MEDKLDKNRVFLKERAYFFIDGKVCPVKCISQTPQNLVYIKGTLHVAAKNSGYYGFGVILPIRETEKELKAKGIKYHIYDSVNDLIDK